MTDSINCAVRCAACRQSLVVSRYGKYGLSKKRFRQAWNRIWRKAGRPHLNSPPDHLDKDRVVLRHPRDC